MDGERAKGGRKRKTLLLYVVNRIVTDYNMIMNKEKSYKEITIQQEE